MNNDRNRLDKTNSVLTIILKVLAIIALLAFLCISIYRYVYLPYLTYKEEQHAAEEASKEKDRLADEANNAAKTTPALTVFFDKGTSEEKINKIGQGISKRSGVYKIVFVSAEQAWNEYKEEYLREYADTFDYDDNQQDFFPYYEVYVNDVTIIDDLSEYVLSFDEVREMHKSGILNDYQHQLDEKD